MSSSARRTLKVLEQIAASGQPLGVTEIARRMGTAPGTVFRALDALQRSEFASRYRESSRYVVGPAAVRLRQSLFAQFRIRDAALPYLRQLASASGETASLIVPLGWYGVRIASARGSNEITNAPHLGPIGPLGRHYASQAILAYLPDPALSAYSAWAAARGRDGGTSKAFRAAIRRIRADGFASEDGGPGQTHVSFAVPVRHRDQAVAAIALEGPLLDLGSGLEDQTAPCVEVVRRIERMVAAHPALAVNPFGHLDPDTILLEQL